MDSEKMKIALTVGVWDLFHEGHLNFLKNCKKYCDYLIVGIMTDYWVKVQKGNDRPIQSLQLRFNNLKKLNLCDKIIVIDTLDMNQYLQICDIWIKSEDQCKMRPDDFHNIVIIERTPEISTTKIINGGLNAINT